MIARKKKICKCGCNREGYIFGKGLIQECYRREYAKAYDKKQKSKNLFKKPISTQGKKRELDKILNRVKSIPKISKRNTYQDDQGNRYTQEEINRRVTKAKKEFQEWFLNEHGYIFCEKCKEEHDQGLVIRSGCEIKDISHTISEKKAKETGQVQLCWDWKNNFRYLGRRHHKIHDKLY